MLRYICEGCCNLDKKYLKRDEIPGSKDYSRFINILTGDLYDFRTWKENRRNVMVGSNRRSKAIEALQNLVYRRRKRFDAYCNDVIAKYVFQLCFDFLSRYIERLCEKSFTRDRAILLPAIE